MIQKVRRIRLDGKLDDARTLDSWGALYDIYSASNSPRWIDSNCGTFEKLVEDKLAPAQSEAREDLGNSERTEVSREERQPAQCAES